MEIRLPADKDAPWHILGGLEDEEVMIINKPPVSSSIPPAATIPVR